MSKSQELLTYIKTKLSEAYEITVDPEMKFYLGHHLVRDRKNKKMWLDQSAMISDMATRFNIPTTGTFLLPLWNICIRTKDLQQSY